MVVLKTGGNTNLAPRLVIELCCRERWKNVVLFSLFEKSYVQLVRNLGTNPITPVFLIARLPLRTK